MRTAQLLRFITDAEVGKITEVSPHTWHGGRLRGQAGLVIGFEGEAKADLAGEYGFPAFSYKFLTQEAAGALVDCDVVLWPDADFPGAENASRKGELIGKAGVRCVAVVVQPLSLPPGGDIVDAVCGFNWTADEISRLIAAAKPLPKQQRWIRSISDIPAVRECGANAVDYIEEPVLIVGATPAFTGDSGCGKSTLVCKLAGRRPPKNYKSAQRTCEEHQRATIRRRPGFQKRVHGLQTDRACTRV